jgi:hypothetical protein
MISILEYSPSPIIPNRGIYKHDPGVQGLKKNKIILGKPKNISLPSMKNTMGININQLRKNKNVGEFGNRWSSTSSMLMNRNPGPGTKMTNVPFK